MDHPASWEKVKDEHPQCWVALIWEIQGYFFSPSIFGSSWLSQPITLNAQGSFTQNLWIIADNYIWSRCNLRCFKNKFAFPSSHMVTFCLKRHLDSLSFNSIKLNTRRRIKTQVSRQCTNFLTRIFFWCGWFLAVGEQIVNCVHFLTVTILSCHPRSYSSIVCRPTCQPPFRWNVMPPQNGLYMHRTIVCFFWVEV